MHQFRIINKNPLRFNKPIVVNVIGFKYGVKLFHSKIKLSKHQKKL
jgi:hypothetical protein